jgi:hypothetical protein
MKTYHSILSLIAVVSVFLLTSCELVGDIFQAGMGVGIFLVVLVIGVIIFIITRLGRRG